MDTVKEPRRRGKGKKEAMGHVNLRLPASVLEKYKQYPGFTAKMREVLVEYLENHPPTT